MNHANIKKRDSPLELRRWKWLALFSLGMFALLAPGMAAIAQRQSAQQQSAQRPRNGVLPPAPDGYQWKVIPELSDEFSAKKLDGAKWLPYHPYWDGREPSHFASQNAATSHGILELRSTSSVKNLADVKNPEKDVWVLSACVASRQPIARYGYYEARLKASRLPMTSSFWLQGKYSEIDVVEQVGASAKHPGLDQFMLMNSHFFSGGWNNDKATPNRWQMATGTADDFHIYGVWWKDEDTLWFYCDGKKAAEVKTGGAFLEPMYLFFDTEVFTWEGLPTVEALSDGTKNTMRVDWVRSWALQKK